MLRRLLKYDMKSILRVWWIIAVSVVGLAAIGSIALRYVVDHGNDDGPALLLIFAMLVAFMSFVGITAASFLSSVLVYIRFYKNFFTDEGYLTFTLPAKASEQLGSKVLVNYFFTAVSTVVVFFDAFIVLAVAVPKEFFDANNWKNFFTVLGELFEDVQAFVPIYVLQMFLLVVALPLLQIMVDYCCITVAATLARKYKVLVAIGIYYGVSVVTSYFSQFAVMSFASESVIKAIEKLSENQLMGMISIVFLVITALIVLVSLALFTWTLYLVNAKLNLD